MKFIATLFPLLLMGLSSIAQTTGINHFSIEDLKWENRILIITGTDQSDSKFRKQTAWFRENIDQNSERDLILALLPDNRVPLAGSEPISRSSANNITDRYVDDRSDFHLILIGKDGTEKFRTSELISPNEIYKRIDKMPMRQREMNQ